MPPIQFNICPFKPPTTITVVGNQLPSNACTDQCALFLSSADPRTGRKIPGVGACSFAVLAVNVAQLREMITVQTTKVGGPPPGTPA